MQPFKAAASSGYWYPSCWNPSRMPWKRMHYAASGWLGKNGGATLENVELPMPRSCCFHACEPGSRAPWNSATNAGCTFFVSAIGTHAPGGKSYMLGSGG